MTYLDLSHSQRAFDRWRDTYNLERPHQALAMTTPASRYRMSNRAFPETLPAIEYSPDDQIRKVQDGGFIRLQGHKFRVGKAFIGSPVGLRQTNRDGVWDVYFCQQHVRRVDLAALSD
jgi:hypothetical protein